MIALTGCKPRYNKAEQLDLAILEYDVKSVQYILDHGADPNTVKKEYFDLPIHNAITVFSVSNTEGRTKKAEEISKLLIKYGADINKRDAIFGSTMLHGAQNLKTVRLLVELGADVNATDSKFGNTPLHAWIIIYKKDLEMFQYLLEHGADVNKKNNSGKTVIDYINDKKLKYSKYEKLREIYHLLHLYKFKNAQL